MSDDTEMDSELVIVVRWDCSCKEKNSFTLGMQDNDDEYQRICPRCGQKYIVQQPSQYEALAIRVYRID